MFLVPDFKGHDFFPHNTRIPFMRYKGLCFGLSLLFMALSFLCFFTLGFNYGVDFKGGSSDRGAGQVGRRPTSQPCATKLEGLGIGDVQIQSFGNDSDVLIRIEQQPGGEEAQQGAMKKVIDTLGGEYVQRRIEVVGPAVSSELRTTGIIAVLASIVAIVIYVWFRFEWQFALGAVVALAHDVLVTAGIFSLFQLQFDLSIVAALLTILGYSVNDTVVVSDRIRENMRKYKKMELDELLTISINETLSRTILTGLTAIAGILALYFFGGEVLRNFSFAMLFGILIGTYSSIFIAAPLLGYLGVKRDWSGTAAAQPKTAAGKV